MTNPAENPSEPQPPDNENEIPPLSSRELVEIAENSGKGSDFIASFTSFIQAGFPAENLLQMLGMKKDEARKRIQEIHNYQTETLRKNAATMRSFGDKALSAIAALNPIDFLKRR